MSHRRSGLLATGVAFVALSFGLVACGGSDDDSSSGSGSGSGGEEVSIYSSFPLQGASRPTGISLQNGIELALEQAGYKAGGVKINFEPMDDSTAQAGEWTPEAESANAKKAVQDDSAVAYLGTYNSGAAAISIPILNEAGLAMLSPGNTAVGLTSDAPGADTGIGEPDIYYPTGERNYARIVPKDTVQGAALAGVMDEDGCTKVGVLNDNEVFGKGLAANVIDAGSQYDYEFVDGGAVDTKAANFRATADDFASQGVDCFIFGGITASNAVQLYKDMAAAMPEAKLYGPDGVADTDFAGGLPDDVAARTKVTVATLSEEDYGKEGAKFFKDYQAKYGDPGPYSIYGYEAGRLILDVLERAEDPTDRAAVLKALFETKNRDSILGNYSINEDGDTTLTDYGVYNIKNGDLEFDEKISAKPGT